MTYNSSKSYHKQLAGFVLFSTCLFSTSVWSDNWSSWSEVNPIKYQLEYKVAKLDNGFGYKIEFRNNSTKDIHFNYFLPEVMGTNKHDEATNARVHVYSGDITDLVIHVDSHGFRGVMNGYGTNILEIYKVRVGADIGGVVNQ